MLQVWERDSSDPIDTIKAHELPLTCFSLLGTPTNASMVTASQDCTAKWWDLETRKEIKTFTGHKGPVTATALVGVLLFTGSTDGTCKVWNLENSACLRTFHMDHSGVSSLCATQEHVFVGLADSTIRQYKLQHDRDPQKGDFNILLDGERVRLFGEIAQLQVKQVKSATIELAYYYCSHTCCCLANSGFRATVEDAQAVCIGPCRPSQR